MFKEDTQAMTIGYLGPKGTFSEVAMETYLKGRPRRAFPFLGIPEVLRALQEDRVELGVVPIENSIEGTVNISLDMLVHEVDLQITGEVVIPVSHCLAGSAGSLEEIKLILSHPQALAQCRNYLDKNIPWAKRGTCESTAEGARQASIGGPGTSAICTALAAGHYGLRLIGEGIQDLKDNFTRFVILGKTPAQPTGDDKTSLVFSLDRDRPGGLYEVLGEFATRGINLTKIESRPARSLLGDYLFFIDCQGHCGEQLVKEAIEAFAPRAAFIKILGSYPAYKEGER